MPTLLLRQREARGDLDEAGATILQMLAEGNLDEGDRLATVVAMLREHPVVDETRDLARSWVNDALAYLDGLEDYPVHSHLVAFAHAMVERMA